MQLDNDGREDLKPSRGPDMETMAMIEAGAWSEYYWAEDVLFSDAHI